MQPWPHGKKARTPLNCNNYLEINFTRIIFRTSEISSTEVPFDASKAFLASEWNFSEADFLKKSFKSWPFRLRWLLGLAIKEHCKLYKTKQGLANPKH